MCFLSSHNADPTHARTLNNLTLAYLNLGMNMEALGMADKVRLSPCSACVCPACKRLRACPTVVRHGECIASNTGRDPAALRAAGSIEDIALQGAARAGAGHSQHGRQGTCMRVARQGL